MRGGDLDFALPRGDTPHPATDGSDQYMASYRRWNEGKLGKVQIFSNQEMDEWNSLSRIVDSAPVTKTLGVNEVAGGIVVSPLESVPEGHLTHKVLV